MFNSTHTINYIIVVNFISQYYYCRYHCYFRLQDSFKGTSIYSLFTFGYIRYNCQLLFNILPCKINNGCIDYTDFKTDYTDYRRKIYLCNLIFNLCNHNLIQLTEQYITQMILTKKVRKAAFTYLLTVYSQSSLLAQDQSISILFIPIWLVNQSK